MTASTPLRLHRFHGGLRLDEHRLAAIGTIGGCSLPEQLSIPLLQHAGQAAEPCVKPGDRVRKGQRIGNAHGLGAHVHAGADGEVIAIQPRPLPRRGDGAALHVQIAVAPVQGPALTLPILDADTCDTALLLDRIRECGIAGLGGAGFPMAEKLGSARDTLILNGIECEPYITCDDALLRARAEQVVRGGLLLGRIVGAKTILLAITSAMTQALAAAAQAIAQWGPGKIELVSVPARYPAGGERQLIEILTGLQVPRGGLPHDIGTLVHNVATAAAAWRAVGQGEPLTSRIVTVAGPGVAHPGNFEVALGTSIAHLIEQAGGYTARAARLLLGGPMTGVALPHDDFPLGKTHNCVLVLTDDELRDTEPEMPCIRCGNCASVCPAQLQPQRLLADLRAGNIARAQGDGVIDCIECGGCDLVCPSHIPLLRQFIDAKANLASQALARQQADAARERYLARGQRLEREAAERAERDAARKASSASADAVAAAIERAKARKQRPKDPNA